ncbi:hypothetical protein WICPIJ_005841 [Wickerhamomyces pijperi]|uniref:AMMECR1 domain-containing protein n=1 Tax=Wickerhamomyces pijperi TaxID=599730 RepID=A0A9P8TLZ4_WICPI|nr:hypothetical protein WICPIJ_005841 [Wickerhamomyces pijperi]
MSTAYPLYAFHSLECYLTRKKEQFTLEQLKTYETKPPKDINSDKIDVRGKYPLFVSYSMTQSQELRGCIGTFGSLPLEAGIHEYSLIAALEDSRFHPVKMHELPRLTVEVTILRDFQEIEDPMDWTIGQHGLVMGVDYNGRHYQGTFLPTVAEKNKWSKDQTLNYLLRKAGVPAHVKWRDQPVQLTRYEGDKVGLTYQEYTKRIEELVQREVHEQPLGNRSDSDKESEETGKTSISGDSAENSIGSSAKDSETTL